MTTKIEEENLKNIWNNLDLNFAKGQAKKEGRQEMKAEVKKMIDENIYCVRCGGNKHKPLLGCMEPLLVVNVIEIEPKLHSLQNHSFGDTCVTKKNRRTKGNLAGEKSPALISIAEVKKMIDNLYLKEECNCEWFLNELKSKLQEMKQK